MRKRCTHSPEFKAKVAMEAMRGRKTIQEIAADHAIHTIQVSQWKRPLLDGASELFCRGKKCWDNAVVESFFSTLKLELNLDDDREVLISPQQLQRDLAFWIEGYYNRERRHSTIGYMSPIDYEQACIAARKLTPVNS